MLFTKKNLEKLSLQLKASELARSEYKARAETAEARVAHLERACSEIQAANIKARDLLAEEHARGNSLGVELLDVKTALGSLRKPGPATDDELLNKWNAETTVSSALRAVYNLGLAHGRSTPSVIEQSNAEADSLVEQLEDVALRNGARGAAHIQKAIRAILAALPPNAVTPPTELSDEECDRLLTVWQYSDGDGHDAIRALLAAAGRYVAPVECRNCELQVCSAHQPSVDRLPYVGLTKEEAEGLEYDLMNGKLAHCIRIIAKALGAGGEK